MGLPSFGETSDNLSLFRVPLLEVFIYMLYNKPDVYSSQNVSLPQGFNESAGVFVYMVSAQDADIGTNSQIVYSLAGSGVEYFSINPSTGVISVSARGVDFEALGGNPVIILDVIATDLGEQEVGFTFLDQARGKTNSC